MPTTKLNYMKYSIAFLFVLISITTNAQTTLVRGPYLQSLTDKSIKIMWRTSDSTQAVVKIGNAPNALNRTIIDTHNIKDHIVLVDGLSAREKYYYSVGTDDVNVLAGGDEQHHFFAAPSVGDTIGFRFWVIGDFGKANSRQVRVRNWFQTYVKDNKVDAWLWLGDNAYQDGKDVEYQEKVFGRTYGYDSILRFLPSYPIPGNHDYNSVNQSKPAEKHTGPYYNNVEVFRNAEMGGIPSKTEAYYSYDFGNVHFMALNSELYTYSIFWDLGSPYKTWIENDIKSTDKKFIVAYIHQPPYSKGSHDTDDFYQIFMQNTREKIVPILEKYGVDVVLSGHSHVYERSYLINGHYARSSYFNKEKVVVDSTDGNPDNGNVYTKYTYGPLKGKGTVYSVIGNSGNYEEHNGKMHPVFTTKYDDTGDNGAGSMILEVKGNELTGTYYTLDGVLFDKFRIVKQDSSTISGIKQNKNIKSLKVYPNPFSEQVTLEVSLDKAAVLDVYIQNLTGELVADKIAFGRANKGVNLIEINNIGDLPAGNYIITIAQDGIFTSKQVVKL